VIATGLDGQFTYDVSVYLPVNNVKLIATSGSGWIEMTATLTVSSSTLSMPNSTPAVSPAITMPFGSAASQLSAALTGSGTTLKWYNASAGDVASFTAPTPNTATAGVTTYWVSQADASGCESARVAIQVTVPAPENVAHVSDEQCGTTLPSATSYVYANLVKNAQAYRFKVTDTFTNEIQTKDYVLRNLMLSSMSFFKYDQQYKIEVAVKRANVWSDFGLPCYVNTPSASTRVIDGQCGGTIARKSDYVYVNQVQYAKGYRFLVTNWSSGFSQVIDSPLRCFSFNSVQNFTMDTMYSIQAAVKNTDGNYLPFGPECTVFVGVSNQVLKTAAQEISQVEVSDVLGVSAYPNPFTGDFRLDIKPASQSTIVVAIYDMIGRLVERREYAVTDLAAVTGGSSLVSSGIYNLIVSQDGQTKTIRMIKR
ncbi:MAG: T9SS type A sorting domain-containing protein, partial [Flavobacterium sp.]